MFWPYLEDEDKVENKKDPKSSKDKQVFMRIALVLMGVLDSP